MQRRVAGVLVSLSIHETSVMKSWRRQNLQINHSLGHRMCLFQNFKYFDQPCQGMNNGHFVAIFFLFVSKQRAWIIISICSHGTIEGRSSEYNSSGAIYVDSGSYAILLEGNKCPHLWKRQDMIKHTCKNKNNIITTHRKLEGRHVKSNVKVN